MTTFPTSYLQTLAKEEAIAFLESLEQVKDHLRQELQWMQAQVQQKSVQIQSIETLLSEASALKLVGTAIQATEEEAAVVPPTDEIVPTTAATDENALELPATTNGITASDKASEPVTTAIAALPNKASSTQQRSSRGKASHTKNPPVSKPSTSPKTNTTKVKQPNSSPSAVKTSQRGRTSGLQQFLKSQWRDKAITEAVGDILDRATAPLSTDEMMTALYDGLPQDDYDRAKHSLANTLSVGRSKGAWRSTGRGRYVGNGSASVEAVTHQ